MVDETLSYDQSVALQDRRNVETRLILAFESQRPMEIGESIPLQGISRITIGRGKVREIVPVSGDTTSIGIRVPDPFMSREHVRLESVCGNWVATDLGSKNGTRLRGESAQRSWLEHGDLLEAGSTFFVFHHQTVDSGVGAGTAARDTMNQDLRAWSDPVGTPLLSLSARLQHQFNVLAELAKSDISIFILGESGTGKELVAKAIHHCSQRHGEYCAVNCGAMAESLMESALFGHRKGAFSGATENHAGLVRAADKGTLFLDEVAELSESAQTRLLRVLQEREVLPLGETRPVRVDIRVLAATHQDIEDYLKTKRFRADLYARLRGFSIDLPPLRERKEDLGWIVTRLLQKHDTGSAQSRRFSRRAARLMFAYDWPLNIRELEQALRAALLLCGSDKEINDMHLPETVRGLGAAPEVDVVGEEAGELPEAQGAQKLELQRLLEKHKGNVSAVAREMGKARVQIRRWCKRYGLAPEHYRTQ